jgi:hypothetical protein
MAVKLKTGTHTTWKIFWPGRGGINLLHFEPQDGETRPAGGSQGLQVYLNLGVRPHKNLDGVQKILER